jgi:hypothetical protein
VILNSRTTQCGRSGDPATNRYPKRHKSVVKMDVGKESLRVKFADCSAEVNPPYKLAEYSPPCTNKGAPNRMRAQAQTVVEQIRACNHSSVAPAEKHKQSAGEVARSLHEPLHSRRDMILRSHARR